MVLGCSSEAVGDGTYGHASSWSLQMKTGCQEASRGDLHFMMAKRKGATFLLLLPGYKLIESWSEEELVVLPSNTSSNSSRERYMIFQPALVSAADKICISIREQSLLNPQERGPPMEAAPAAQNDVIMTKLDGNCRKEMASTEEATPAARQLPRMDRHQMLLTFQGKDIIGIGSITGFAEAFLCLCKCTSNICASNGTPILCFNLCQHKPAREPGS